MKIEKTKLIAIIFFISLFFSFASFTIAQGCVKSQPTITISPKDLSGVAGSTVAYDISVKNNDAALCDPSIFNIVVSSAGYSSFLSKNSISLISGEEQKILLNINIPSNTVSGSKDISATASSGNYQATDTAKLTVIEEPKSCTLSVDSVEVMEENDNTAKTLFCENLNLKVKTKVSVSGDTGTSALVQLYVGGSLFDTRNVILAQGSFAGFTFNRLIDTKALGLNSFEVKVVAKSSCDVDGDSNSQTISEESCIDKCEFSTSVAKPSDTSVGEKIATNVLVKNVGGVDDNNVDIVTLLCKSDFSDDCKTMKCDSSSFSVDHGELKNIPCSTTVDKEGTYKVKLNSVTCGETNIDYSNDFIVSAKTISQSLCNQNLENQLRCSGNVIQKSSLKSDCSVEWNDVEYCPFGCSNGICQTPVETPAKETIAATSQNKENVSSEVSAKKSEAPAQEPLVEYLQILVLVFVIAFILLKFPKKVFGQ